MKLCDLLKKVNTLTVDADLDTDISGISYDTRTLSPGDLFVAIRGLEFDGHMYIEEAVKKGAACVICEEELFIDAQYIVVENSRKALALVSAEWFGHPAEKIKIIGATGTNGKTTVTTLIKCVLENCTGGKIGLIGTNGNLIGDKEYLTSFTTPESFEIQKLLAMMVDEGCKYAVMEVSSHALALYRVYGITFEVGIYTNLSPEHLDFHKTMEEYARAKALLFSYCRHSVINIDDEYASVMVKTAHDHVYTYSIKNETADLVGKNVHLSPDKVEFCALTIGHLCRVEVDIPGLFSVYNALATISAALLLEFELEDIATAIRTCDSAKGRVEVVPTNTDYTVLIDYAHTPDALLNILSMARGSTKGRVVTLFGCGGDRDKTKRPIMGEIAAKHSDFVVVTTDNPRTEDPNEIISQILVGMEGTKTPYEVIPNRCDAIHWALRNSRADDVLILAGKGHETYQIIGTEKNHFDEREIVAEYFKQ